MKYRYCSTKDTASTLNPSVIIALKKVIHIIHNIAMKHSYRWQYYSTTIAHKLYFDKWQEWSTPSISPYCTSHGLASISWQHSIRPITCSSTNLVYFLRPVQPRPIADPNVGHVAYIIPLIQHVYIRSPQAKLRQSAARYLIAVGCSWLCFCSCKTWKFVRHHSDML